MLWWLTLIAFVLVFVGGTLVSLCAELKKSPPQNAVAPARRPTGAATTQRRGNLFAAKKAPTHKHDRSATTKRAPTKTTAAPHVEEVRSID